MGYAAIYGYLQMTYQWWIMFRYQIILISISLIFAIVAVYLSIKSLKSWKENDLDIIKAKVFLDKSFLNNNFKISLALAWIIIGLVSIHSIMEYLEFNGSIFYGFDLIYYSVLPVAMLSLVLMTYIWFKILSRPQHRKI